MPEIDSAQIYLATPQAFDLAEFSASLAEVLDAIPVACLRISMATKDEGTLSKAADTLREICHARDVAIVIDDHYRMVKTHGVDGVHLTDGARHVRDARAELGQDAIVGAFCGTEKHQGMTAGEIGTDYISFGPIGDSALGDGSVAGADLFQWWSEMIEIPVIAEGSISAENLLSIKDHIDFLTLGTEIWAAPEGPVVALKKMSAILAQ